MAGKNEQIAVLYNTTGETRIAYHAGAIYIFDPASYRAIHAIHDPASRTWIPAWEIKEHLMRGNLKGQGVIELDVDILTDEKMPQAEKEEYIRSMGAKGWQEYVEWIDGQWEEHVRMNDERKQDGRGQKGPHKELRRLIAARNAYANKLESLGEFVPDMPEMKVPEIKMPDIPLPTSRKKASALPSDGMSVKVSDPVPDDIRTAAKVAKQQKFTKKMDAPLLPPTPEELEAQEAAPL